jgi:8-oxo-dGTP pyrophosphatase MutT (NUDIX family)
MTWRPDLTVAAIAQRDDGRFLVVEERIGDAIVFNQPAGHVEEGESIVEAVIRETLEETAWQFKPLHLVGMYLWRNPANGRSILRVAFSGEAHSHDTTRRLDRGILASHWMSREQLAVQAARLRSPLVLQCIDDHLAGRRFGLDALTHIPVQAVAQSA